MAVSLLLFLGPSSLLSHRSSQGCTSCESGKYRPQRSHAYTYCVSWSTCGRGERETSSPSSTTNRGCSSCLPGTYQSSSSHTSRTCPGCNADTYQDQYGQASCKSCSTGYYRSSASSQAPCTAGYRCPGKCRRYACGGGTYQDGDKATTCKSWYVSLPAGVHRGKRQGRDQHHTR